MHRQPGLLLISWNRREYIEKTLPRILDDPSDFTLYLWDNGSRDGTADIICDVDDSRVAAKHFSRENVGQQKPWFWFLEKCRHAILGKIDDDILLPSKWTESIGSAVARNPQIGMLGCWAFMGSDWNEHLAQKNIVEVSGGRVFRAVGIAGHSFLARRERLLKYAYTPKRPGLPVDRVRMTLNGYLSGFLYPLIRAHNMDDPRSPLNRYTRLGCELSEFCALTAKNRRCRTAEAYATTIADDARRIQEVPIDEQVARVRGSASAKHR